MQVDVRPAGPADLDTIVALRIEFLGAVRGPGFSASQDLVERTRSFTATEQEAGRLHTWIAEDASGPVGIASLLLWPRPPQPEDLRTTEAYVINMFVLPSHRRQGIGQRLLATCLEASADFGVRKLLLHATDEGRALYEGAGFAPKSNWMERPIGP